MFKNWIDPFDPDDVIYERNARLRRKKYLGHRSQPAGGPKPFRKHRTRRKEKLSRDDEDTEMYYESSHPISTAMTSIITNNFEIPGYIPSFAEYIAQRAIASSGILTAAASISATPSPPPLYSFCGSGYGLLSFHRFTPTN